MHALVGLFLSFAKPGESPPLRFAESHMLCACRLTLLARGASQPLRVLAARHSALVRAHPVLAAHTAAAASRPVRTAAAQREQGSSGMAPDGAEPSVCAEQEKQQRQEREREQRRRPSLWWKDRPSYLCPACGQRCFKVSSRDCRRAACTDGLT